MSIEEKEEELFDSICEKITTNRNLIQEAFEKFSDVDFEKKWECWTRRPLQYEFNYSFCEEWILHYFLERNDLFEAEEDLLKPEFENDFIHPDFNEFKRPKKEARIVPLFKELFRHMGTVLS